MDWKYILKRVIVGVLIFLAIYFLKNFVLLDVHAQEISSYNWGSQSFNVTTGTSMNEFNVQDEPWANWRYGYLHFSIGVNKTGGSSTDPILLIRNVIVFSGTTGYICNIGTNNVNNSTWDASVYSVTCPMDLGAPGVSRVVIGYMPISQQSTSTYTVTVGGYATYEQASDVSVSVDTSSTNQAINNQITNDNTNTTNIINNQNQNTQQQIESQKVCTVYDSSAGIEDGYLNSRGTVDSSTTSTTTDYLSINNTSTVTILTDGGNNNRICFYNTNKSLISCIGTATAGDVTIPANASFLRVSIYKPNNRPTIKICKNGNQAIADGQQAINDSLNDDSINADTGEDFFSDFHFGDDTLSAVVTAPISFLNSLTSSQCSPYTFTLYNQTVSIPCGSIVWGRNDFSNFRNWWNLFFGGIAIYTLGLKLFKVVHDAIDPSKDNIESVGVA